jgi:hypothetical protein
LDLYSTLDRIDHTAKLSKQVISRSIYYSAPVLLDKICHSFFMSMLGMAYVWLKEYDKAIAEAEKAVSLDSSAGQDTSIFLLIFTFNRKFSIPKNYHDCR